MSQSLQKKLFSKIKSRRTRGLTLMEVAMVLAIIGIVIAAALIYFSQANTSQKQTQALGQLAQIRQSVRSLYSGQSNYSGLVTASIATSQSLPASMVNGNTIKHAFGGLVTIESTTASGGADSGYAVTFAQIPQDACKQMLTKDLGRDLYSAGASSTLTQPNLPFTLAQATTSCASTYNDITWTFN